MIDKGAIKKSWERSLGEVLSFLKDNPKAKIYIFLFVGFLSIFTISKLSESNKVIYKKTKNPSFSDGRILGTQKASFLKSKEQKLSQMANSLLKSNKALELKLKKLEKRLEAKS